MVAKKQFNSHLNKDKGSPYRTYKNSIDGTNLNWEEIHFETIEISAREK